MSLCLREFLKEKDIKSRVDYPLSRLSSIGIGGSAALIAYPEDTESMCRLISLASSVGASYRVVGGMTNILPSDDGFVGLVISTVRLNRMERTENLLYAECGALTSGAVLHMADEGYGTAEGLASIPGTVGGAVMGNAGAFGVEISELFTEGTFFSPSTGFVVFKKKDLSFGYRTLTLPYDDLVFLSGVFEFREKSRNEIMAKILENREKRKATQPLGKPSLGSIFKAVNGVGAGYYIDKAGLKGFSVGGARVSEKHAGFIINEGGATSFDVKALIKIIKTRVREHFGVKLTEEIKYM